MKKAKSTKNTGKVKVTKNALTKGVKKAQKKAKADRTAQIENRGKVQPRNDMVNTMIKKGPVKKADVVKAILKKYPTTSKKMASRTITRGKNPKYNDKYTKFDSLIVEAKIDGVAYLAFTKKALNDLKKATKKADKAKTKDKAKAKA